MSKFDGWEHHDLYEELANLTEKVARYEKWFDDNATMLATHRIGGFVFASDLRGLRPDMVVIDDENDG